MPDPLLQLQNVQKSYQIGPETVHVLRGISLNVDDGEFVAIMGVSGSGKSTLLHLAGALDRPDIGAILFRGQSINDMNFWNRHQLRNQHFGFVFQFYHLLPELSVLENVLLPAMVDPIPKWLLYGLYTPAAILTALGIVGCLLPGVVAFLIPVEPILSIIFLAIGMLILVALESIAFSKGIFRIYFKQKSKKREALELLESFGLSHRLKHRPNQLSGGERQRVAIARALINQPALLLADEPTGNLDAKTGRAILDVLIELHKTRGQSILLVTHDPQVAALADRIVHLVDGRVRAK